MKKTKLYAIFSLTVCIAMLFSSLSVFALSTGVIYDGSGELEISGPSYFDDAQTQRRFTGNGDIAGNYGKSANDLVYKLEGYSTRSGGANDFLSYWLFDRTTDKYLLQTQVLITDNTTSIDYLFGFFTDDNSDGKNNNSGGNIFRISKDGNLTVTGDTYLPEAYRNKTLAALEKYRWYNIAMGTSISENKVYIFVNGEKLAELDMAVKMYGTRHMRIATGMAPDEAKKIPFEAYMDNVVLYKNAVYDTEANAPASLVSDKYTISDNTIALNGIDITAGDVLQSVSAENANIRIFQDSQMTKQIVGDEPILSESVLVCAAKNADNCETTYKYYSFSLPADESGLLSGTQTLNIIKNTSLDTEGGTEALVYPTNGSYGKKSNDYTYFWGGKTIGHGGQLYLNLGNSTKEKPAEVFEFSFLLGEGSNGFKIDAAPFCIEKDGTQSTNHASNYPLSFSLSGIETLSSVATIKLADLGYSLDGTNCILDKDTRNKKLCDIEKNKWYAVTLVFPADGTNKFFMYVNGQKYELGFNFIPGSMRHTRLIANKCENQILCLDNIKVSSMTSAEAKNYVCRDTKESVEFIGFSAKKNIIADVLPGTTVADMKAKISTDANIRFYKDASCSRILADDEELTNSSVMVAASTGNTLHERVFDYYNITVANDYDELTAGIRITNLSVNLQDGSNAVNASAAENEYFAAFEAKNLSESAAQLTVAIAVYDKDMTLKNIKVQKINLSAGEEKTVTANDNIKVSNTLTSGNVYVYAWLADTLKPVADSVGISFNAQ